MAYRPKDTQERILHRLKIAHGHLNKVIRMIEEDTYCIDVITQSRAVQHALKETDYLLLENHLQTCVVDLVHKGKAKQSVEEIMTLFRNHNK